MKVSGKVVVVVGGGNGIGRAVVLELLRRGARVAAVDVRKESLDETAELAAAGERLATFAVDITDRAAVDVLPEAVHDALGEPDVLVNVAGIIQPFVPLVDLDLDAMERVLDVNLWGTIHTCKAFLPGLLTRPEAHIANVSSMGAFLPVPGQSVYGASKAAVKLLTEGLYAELLDTSVGVTVVLQGSSSTRIAEHSGIDLSGLPSEGSSRIRLISPEDSARAIVDGIEAGRLHVFVGRDSRTMDAAVRLAPKRAIHLIQRQMRELLG